MRASNAIARFEDEGDPMKKKAGDLQEQMVTPRPTAIKETRSSDLQPQRTGLSQQPEWDWKQILPQSL